MAAFNGERFIQAQLESILPQLASDDKIVIVNDCSQDETIARVVGLGDARIRLFAHQSNEGVVVTFEDALRCATGDILFSLTMTISGTRRKSREFCASSRSTRK